MADWFKHLWMIPAAIILWYALITFIKIVAGISGDKDG